MARQSTYVVVAYHAYDTHHTYLWTYRISQILRASVEAPDSFDSQSLCGWGMVIYIRWGSSEPYSSKFCFNAVMILYILDHTIRTMQPQAHACKYNNCQLFPFVKL